MNNKQKRVISLLLSAVMLFGLLTATPLNIPAATAAINISTLTADANNAAGTAPWTFNGTTRTLTLTGAGDTYTLTGTNTNLNIIVAASATNSAITMNGLNVVSTGNYHTFEVRADYCFISLTGTNSLTAPNGNGMRVDYGLHLSIQGPGSLTVSAGGSENVFVIMYSTILNITDGATVTASKSGVGAGVYCGEGVHINVAAGAKLSASGSSGINPGNNMQLNVNGELIAKGTRSGLDGGHGIGTATSGTLRIAMKITGTGKVSATGDGSYGIGLNYKGAIEIVDCDVTAVGVSREAINYDLDVIKMNDAAKLTMTNGYTFVETHTFERTLETSEYRWNLSGYASATGPLHNDDAIISVAVAAKSTGTVARGPVPPSIIVQPADTSVTVSGSTSIIVAADGAPTLTYQWQVYSGGTWINIPTGGSSIYTGTTTATLRLANVPITTNGAQVRCVVSNTAGTVTSSTATLTVVSSGTVTNTVTVNSGTGGGSYAAGATVSISANAAPAGKTFDKWTATGVTLTSPTSASTSFTMPSNAVTITAMYKYSQSYAVTVQSGGNGTASADPASAIAGTMINLTATPNSGYRLKEWQVISGGVNVADNKFIMPNNAVTVKAVFELIPVAPGITGPTALSLTYGYAATSTDVFTATGTAPVTVAKTSGSTSITWNNTTKKLDIAAGLAAGSYPVVLTASNGISPDATITFTLTVNKTNQTALVITSPVTKTYGDAAFQLAATGGNGTGAVTYELVSGSGTVTGNGTVTITGAGSIVVKATKAADANYNSVTSANLTITVNPASLTLTADNKSILTGAGQPAYTYTVTGLKGSDTAAAVITTQPTMSVTGFSSATPTTFPIVITGGAANANYTITNRVNGTLTVTAAPVAPVITSANSTTAVNGTAKTFQVTATGTMPITYSLSGQPSGVSINSTSGLITIAATTAVGTHNFTITAANGTNPNATQSFTLTVSAAITVPVVSNVRADNISQTSAGIYYALDKDAKVYSAIYAGTATGMTAAQVKTAAGAVYTYEMDVPSGTTWNFTASPLAPNTQYTAYFVANNAGGDSEVVSVTFTTLAVIAAPAIISANNTTAVNGTGGTFQVTATGNEPIIYSLSGQPAGVTINNNTGLINISAATAAGTYNFTVTASNGTAPDAVQSFTLTVSAVIIAPGITGPTTLSLTEGYASASTGEYTLTGTEPVTVTKISGDGKITWNAVTQKLDIAAGLAAGTYVVVLKVSNGTGTDATLTFTLTVTPAPAFYQSFENDTIKIWADAGVIPAGAVFDVRRIMPPPVAATEKVNEQLPGSTIIDYYEIRLVLDGNLITKLSGDLIIASKLPAGYESGAGVSVYQEDANGTLIKMESWVENGYIFFRTNWLEAYSQ